VLAGTAVSSPVRPAAPVDVALLAPVAGVLAEEVSLEEVLLDFPEEEHAARTTAHTAAVPTIKAREPKNLDRSSRFAGRVLVASGQITVQLSLYVVEKWRRK
jgi:hypothetical protein